MQIFFSMKRFWLNYILSKINHWYFWLLLLYVKWSLLLYRIISVINKWHGTNYKLLNFRAKPLKAVLGLWSNKGNMFAYEPMKRALPVHNSISVLFQVSSMVPVPSFNVEPHNGHDLILKAPWLLVKYRDDNHHESQRRPRIANRPKIPRHIPEISFHNWRFKCFSLSIELATKWLRILSIPPNDKIRNHLVANPIVPPAHVSFKRYFSEAN